MLNLSSVFSAARHQLRDRERCLPGFKQLLTTTEGHHKVTYEMVQRGILGQYKHVRG
jgi:hypothetical protein